MPTSPFFIMLHSSSYRRYLPPGILALALLVVYLTTLAPGLTWANAGADGGDLITAAYTGGVPHPTGYPVYLLLARFFQLLPVGSLAFRTNLMSALATAGAAVLLYQLVIRSLAPADESVLKKELNIHSPQRTLSSRRFLKGLLRVLGVLRGESVGQAHAINHPPADECRMWPAGLVAGFAFGLSPLVWSQAVITEVYALQSLFVVLILYLSTEVMPAGKNVERWRGLTLGLAMGNHLTTILLIPAAILASVVRQPGPEPSPRWTLAGKSLLRQMTYLALGPLTYLILPLRAAFRPPVNWGNPITFDRLWWLISGGLYQGTLFFEPGETWGHLQLLVSTFLQQFGFIGLAVAVIGLVLFFQPSRLYFLTLYLMVVSSLFSIVYDAFDSYVYLIPAIISFSIWMGLGIAGLTKAVGHRAPKLAWCLPLLLALSLLSLLPRHWDQVDASHDLRAENFGREVLEAAPPDAVVFAKGDRAVFVLWYFHFALHQRPDVVVIATELLHFDWYQETLRSSYPSLALPGPFPFPETVVLANPLAPACSVEYDEQTVIDCKPPADSH